MNMEKQQQREIMDEDSLIKFNDLIKSQQQINHRSADLIRYTVIFLVLLFVVVAYFSWSLKQDMTEMNSYMAEMANGVSSMNNAIGQMQGSIGTMERGINKVAHHTQSISSSIVKQGNSDDSDGSMTVLSDIAQSVKLMQGEAHGLNKSIENMNHNLTTINKYMRSLNRKLGAMGQNNSMPSPVRMFPF